MEKRNVEEYVLTGKLSLTVLAAASTSKHVSNLSGKPSHIPPHFLITSRKRLAINIPLHIPIPPRHSLKHNIIVTAPHPHLHQYINPQFLLFHLLWPRRRGCRAGICVC
jgi:hypothetical protein